MKRAANQPRRRGRPPGTGTVPRREELLQAAGRLFAEQGYAATSTAEIAEAVGLTQPAIFYHFVSKEEMLRELMNSSLVESLAELDAVMSADAGNGAKLYRQIVFQVSHDMRLPFAPTVLIDDGQRLLKDGQHLDLVGKARRYSHGIRRIIRLGMKSGEFRNVDPVAAAMAVLGMCNWALRWYRREGRLSPEALGHQFAEFALTALLADPGDLDAVREAAERLADLRSSGA